MEASSTAITRVEKFNNTNIYSKKQKMGLIFEYKKVDNIIDVNFCANQPTEKEELKEWLKKDDNFE